MRFFGSYDNNGKLSLDELNNNLKNNIPELTYQGKPISDNNKIGSLPATVIVDGYEVIIDGATSTPNMVKPGEKVTGENKEYIDKDRDTAIIPVGFAIVPELDDISEGLVISDVANDTANEGNQFVWIPVGNNTPYERNKTYLDTNVSTTAYDDIGYLPDGITNEEDAVRSAGGFYISRYEAGKEGTATVVSKKEANVWVSISQTDAKSTAKTMFTNNSHVKSALISGVQWDICMAFVDGKMDGTNEVFDVTKYDNRRHIGEDIVVSGNNKADKVCNIYDLEGNAYEFTEERNTYYAGGTFVGRGGSNYDGYGIYPASYGGSCSGNADSSYSFRIVLYVK